MRRMLLLAVLVAATIAVGRWLRVAEAVQVTAAAPVGSQPARPVPVFTTGGALPDLPQDRPFLVEAKPVDGEERLHPRDPGEWQGMLVDVSRSQECSSSGGCGLALACKGGMCGPCGADRECSSGEICVLDHCILGAAAGCRSRQDCPNEGLCLLSGITADPRGNGRMISRCIATRGAVSPLSSTEASPFLPQALLPAPGTSVPSLTEADLLRGL